MNRKKNYPLRDISDPTEAGKKRQERFMTDRKRRVSSFQKFLNISMFIVILLFMALTYIFIKK